MSFVFCEMNFADTVTIPEWREQRLEDRKAKVLRRDRFQACDQVEKRSQTKPLGLKAIKSVGYAVCRENEAIEVKSFNFRLL